MADLLELRLDHFSKRDAPFLSELMSQYPIPMIFTLRSKEQGGLYQGSKMDYFEEICSVAECGPAYLDVEYILPKEYVERLSLKFPQQHFIISQHHFKKQQESLQMLLDGMPKVRRAFYKIAKIVDHCSETLQELISAKKIPGLIPICMGEEGQLSRILAPVIGSPISYATLNENHLSAPGQLTAKMLKDVYQYSSININTSLYGLIGDPVTKSIGHYAHNALMKKLNLNAIYVKMKVEEESLLKVLKLCLTLGFKGLSVTMPLKEKIIPFLDEVDEIAHQIGSVNTVLIKNGRLIGSNTDGIGALNSIEQYGSVKDKKLIILGSGGAARAIIYEARKRGAQVTILNRTKAKAQDLAKRFDCHSDSLSNMEKYAIEGYDLIVNCTPESLPIDSQFIVEKATVMEIATHPKDSQLLALAKSKGCKIIYGYEMFVVQALWQLKTWFPDSDLKDAKTELLSASKIALASNYTLT